MWCCRVCFLSDTIARTPGDGLPGAAVVGPDPNNPAVCARGHPWHHPIHAVGGRGVRPAPQRHGARRGGGCYLMLCRVAGCTSETCQFAHSAAELEHWRQRVPPPAARAFHPAVVRALEALEIPLPVTDNIREKINALSLGDVLLRLRAARRRGGRGYAALLGALRGPPPPPGAAGGVAEDDEKSDTEGPPPPPEWSEWAWPEWEAIRATLNGLRAPLPTSPWAARRACGTELLACLAVASLGDE